MIIIAALFGVGAWLLNAALALWVFGHLGQAQTAALYGGALIVGAIVGTYADSKLH